MMCFIDLAPSLIASGKPPIATDFREFSGYWNIAPLRDIDFLTLALLNFILYQYNIDCPKVSDPIRKIPINSVIRLDN